MGLLTVVDDKDVVVGKATKKEIIQNKWNYRCVHMYIFNNKKQLLIGKRPHFMKRFPDKWTACCGGKVDAGESYEVAAHREMKEELGIETELKEQSKFTYINELYGYKVFHRIYVGNYEGPFHPEPNEIEAIKWVSEEWLEKDIKNNPKKYALVFQESFKSYLKKK